MDANCLSLRTFSSKSSAARKQTQKGLVSRDTSPFIFPARICSASLPCRTCQTSWWSWRRELNPRPSDYKSDALPAELRQRRSNPLRIAEGANELQAKIKISSTSRASSVEKHFLCVEGLSGYIFCRFYSLASMLGLPPTDLDAPPGKRIPPPGATAKPGTG